MLMLEAACTDPFSSGNPVGAVFVEATQVDLPLGETVSLSAAVLDTDGHVLLGREIHWASRDIRVARVSPDGIVHGVGGGATTITAESGGRSAEVTVAVSVAFRSVSAGLFHTCAVTVNGVAACWGINGSGELGDGTVFSSSAPVAVAGDLRFLDAAAGGTQGCGLSDARAILCWGANWSAQLGLGTIDTDVHASPEPTTGPRGSNDLTVGDRHACAVTSSGTILCWGGGVSGQLGTGSAGAICTALPEPCNPSPVPIQSTRVFQAVDAGIEHTCGLTTDGDILCWGSNAFGQLGDGTTDSRANPALVVGGLKFVSLSAGGGHTCATTDAGVAYCWGSNALGQLGAIAETPVAAPVPVAGGLRFNALATGDDHTCGVASSGTAYCWGANGFGQLGLGGRSDAALPTAVAGGMSFVTLSAGALHTCGIATDGVTYCWGLNNRGQVGTGGGLFETTPARVLGQLP
jgi:alpha-tubulin suppressor-like RCC1 family protein